MNYLKTKIYKTHGEKYTLTKLIIHITEHYPILIVDLFSQNLNVIDSKILPFQYSSHDAVLAEFVLRVRTCGPGNWKLNIPVLDHKTFRIAFQTFWQEWKR